jgi:hypothetical protein
VKQIAIVLFALSFAAVPARADGIKGVVGTLGLGALSTIGCLLTGIYGPEEEEDTSGEDFDRTGFFVGLGAGYAGENFSDRPVYEIADIFSNQPGREVAIEPGPETTGDSDDGWSVKGRGGYRCHPRYSIGATAELFGGFDTDWVGPLGMGSDDIDIFAVTVDIKGYLLTGRYQPYVLLGGGTMNIDTKVTNPAGMGKTFPNPTPPEPNLWTPGPVIQSRNYTDFVFRFGVGFDVYTTENVVVNIDANYLLPLGVVSTVDIYTVGGGIEYRF